MNNLKKLLKPRLRIGIKNHKKGFTLLELVLVVSILAILSAILIPMTGADNTIGEANSRARGLYYNLQGVMTDYRLDYDRDPARTDILAPQTYYLYIQASKIYTDATNLSHVASYKLATDKNFSSLIADSSTSSDLGKILSDRLRHTVGEIDKDSHFYAEIDDKFRVKQVYWSEEELAAGDSITSNNRVDGVLAGAFPDLDFSTGAVTIFP